MVSNPFGQGLSVRISANSRDFERGVENAQDSLRDFAASAVGSLGPLQALQGRADEAGDELADVGREAGQASGRLAVMSGSAASAGGAFSALAFSTEGLSLSFGSLTSTMTGTVALLGVVTAAATALVSALVPLAAILGTMTAGLGAVAGAFGAIIGSGIIAFGRERGEQNEARLEQIRAQIDRLEELRDTEAGLTDAQEDQLETLEDQESKLEDTTGVMGGLQSAFADLRDELVPIIADFGERFIPLIEDALDAVPDLVEDIIAAMGGFDTLSNALREMGRTAFRVLPDFFGWMTMIAQIALPPLRDFFGWLLRNGADIFRGMLATTRRLAPMFLRFIDTLIDAAPEINDLGSRVLNVLVPALGRFIEFVEDVVQIGQQSDSFVGFIRNAVDALITWVQGPGRAKIQSVVQSIKNALTALLGGEEDDTLLTAFTDFVAGILDRVATWIEGGGQQQIQNLLRSVFDSMATVLMGNAGEFSNRILDPLIRILSSLFDALTNALMSDEAGRLGTAIGNFAGAIGSLIGQRLLEWFRSGQFLSFAGRIIGAIGTGLGSALVGLLSGEPPGTLRGQSTGQRIQEGLFTQRDARFFAGVADSAQGVNATTRGDQIIVNVTGDTGVIEDVAVETTRGEFRAREDRNQRRTGPTINR